MAARKASAYTYFVIRLIPALGMLFLTAGARAHESSSPRYTNAGGAQATISTPAAAPVPKAAPSPRKIHIAPAAAAAPVKPPAVPTPEPARGAKTPLLGALALALGAGAFAYQRRSRARRRADDENFTLAAHELQSPLAAIESYLDLMASEAPSATPEARRWLEDVSRMRTTTAHLRRTITDILDMTRVEDGRVKLSARPLDLAALTQASVAAYAPHAASRGIALTSTVPAGLAEALADPDRLRQVLDNLIGNAIKFTPEGRAITVTGREATGEVILEVRDEGVGVPADRRARLFGKFQRLGPAVDGTEGTGLGLYLSHRLVSAQGGRLEYEPGKTGGSVFRVTMPRA